MALPTRSTGRLPPPRQGIAAAVTYLYRGEFRHRDSLGTDQMIYPGEVNWMIARHGVTHSERTSAETRKGPHRLFGIQTWIALPESHEEMAAAFGAEPLHLVEFRAHPQGADRGSPGSLAPRRLRPRLVPAAAGR